ncbi:hypothetical protein [Gryllotalpicola koreensis]
MPESRRRPIKQWAPLGSLLGAVAGSGVGASLGQPHSWAWFLGGAAAVWVVAGAEALRRRGRAHAQSGGEG